MELFKNRQQLLHGCVSTDSAEGRGMVDGCLAVIFLPSLLLSYCVNRRSDQIYTRKVRLNVSLFSWNGVGRGVGECLNETFIYVVQVAQHCLCR